MVDCSTPRFCASGVIIDPFNTTKFGALITFHCKEQNDTLITSHCSSNGEWIPDPNSYDCGTTYSTTGKKLLQVLLIITLLYIIMALSCCIIKTNYNHKRSRFSYYL